MTLEQIKARIADRLDPDEIVDRLGLTSSELVEILEDHIADNKSVFYDMLEDEDE